MPAAGPRSTWTIIGRPAMSDSGLPGSRVAAMRAGISTRVRGSVTGFRPGSHDQELVGIGGELGRLSGLPERGQTDISSSLGCGAKARFLLLIRPSHRPYVDIPAWSLIENGLLRTQ
jgi:hypothetical protein